MFVFGVHAVADLWLLPECVVPVLSIHLYLLFVCAWEEHALSTL